MSPLSIVSTAKRTLRDPGADHSMEGDWLADPVETSRRTIGARRRENDGATTRDKRRIAWIQHVSKRGIQEVEEASGRTTREQPRPPHSSSFNPFGSPRLSKFCRIWHLRVAHFGFLSRHLFISYSRNRIKLRSNAVPKFRSQP